MNKNKVFVLFCLFSSSITLGRAFVAIKEEDFPELRFVSSSVDPCDNFYEYACGNFKNFHPLGKERVVDEFTLTTERIIKLMIDILKEGGTSSSEALNKVKTAFESCLDLKTTDARTPHPEVLFLNEVGGMPLFKTPKNQPNFGWKQIGQLTSKYGVPLFFKITVIPFPITATDNLIRIEDSSEIQTYLEELEGNDSPFRIFLTKIFTALRNQINVDVTDEEIQDGIREIKQFLNDIYTAGLATNGTVKPLETTTVVGDLQEWTEEQFDDDSPIDWFEFLDAVFGGAGVKMTNSTNVYLNSIYAYNVLKVVRNTRPEVVKNFVLTRMLLFSAMESHWSIRSALEEYYRAKNSMIYSRDEYCARQLIDVDQSDMVVGLSVASARLFVEHHKGKERLFKAKNMIKDLAGTFARFIMDSNWMDSFSKFAAIEKAKKMAALIGLPESFENDTSLDRFYESLTIKNGDGYGNTQRLRSFKQAYAFSQVGKPRNRARWDRSPFETNAYYNRGNNKITIPFAMMNPIFFNGTFSMMDYSHLGSLVGHEITHGFDNSGRKYDGDGVLTDIWTNETLIAYQEKIKCFKRQYSSYFVKELNKTVDGTASLNENLADNGGVRISYAASKKFFRNSKMASGKYTAEQLFFIGYATTFCSTETKEYLEYSLNKGYSPSKYRIIGALSNMEEFSKAFNCPRGSVMNPNEKCSLW